MTRQRTSEVRHGCTCEPLRGCANPQTRCAHHLLKTVQNSFRHFRGPPALHCANAIMVGESSSVPQPGTAGRSDRVQASKACINPLVPAQKILGSQAALRGQRRTAALPEGQQPLALLFKQLNWRLLGPALSLPPHNSTRGVVVC